jgi:hypothetical protein
VFARLTRSAMCRQVAPNKRDGDLPPVASLPPAGYAMKKAQIG